MTDLRTYRRPRTWTAAGAGAYLAGGTDLVPLMRTGVVRPVALVDLRELLPAGMELRSDAVVIGAMARLVDVADAVDDHCPALAEALRGSASPQVRNMATVGGNLLQRTRCGYFRTPAFPCNKRAPGSGCPAWGGHNRRHAIFGVSEHCIAAHASDVAVALCALDARIVVRATDGALRTVALDAFYLLPADTPDRETVLEPGEVIHSVEVPLDRAARRSTYLKLRDRAAFDFALVSAAVGLALRDGAVGEARIALGGVGTRPWRLRAAEARLAGAPLDADRIRRALRDLDQGARPTSQNAFKLELARALVERALTDLAA